MKYTDSDKKVVIIISTMRSGSTLLKALLASNPDVSDLPEVDFQKYRHSKDKSDAVELSDRKIVIMKKPAWFNEIRSYPRLPPFSDLQTITLIRDVYSTVMSMRKMVFGPAEKFLRGVGDRFLAEKYWAGITENLLQKHEHSDINSILLRYEDLTDNPIDETSRLFKFIGTNNTKGVSSYHPPQSRKWRWGKDDASEKIKSLQVQPLPKPTYDNRNLQKIIQNSSRIQRIRERLGYS